MFCSLEFPKYGHVYLFCINVPKGFKIGLGLGPVVGILRDVHHGPIVYGHGVLDQAGLALPGALHKGLEVGVVLFSARGIGRAAVVIAVAKVECGVVGVAQGGKAAAVQGIDNGLGHLHGAVATTEPEQGITVAALQVQKGGEQKT